MGKTVAKVLMIAAIVVGVAALVATGAGLFVIGGAAAVTAALGGVSAAMLSVAATVLSIGASLLAPHPKAPSLGAATLDRLHVTLDPNTPRKAIFGNTAGATDLRDQEIENISGTTDDMNVHRWIVVAAHKVNSIYEIWFEDELVWTVGGGVVNSKYTSYLTVSAILEGSAANVIAYSGRTPSGSRRFTGCAYVYFRFLLNSESPFNGSIPDRVTIRTKGMPTYDPRKDTTVAGGSGSQRANDCTTWQYDVSGNLQGENVALQLLSWTLGWYIVNPSTSQRVLSVGKGIPSDRIDMPSFIVGANICDETVTLAAGGSERRYRGAGITSEGEDTTSVADRFKAAMNADLDDVDGKIRLQIFMNDLGAPVATFTENDVLGTFEWRPANNSLADINIIRGRFPNPGDNNLYQLTDYPEVKVTSRDGIDRPEQVDFGFVQSQSQCERLAKTRLQRMQFPGMFKAQFQFRAHRVQKGDPILFTFGPLGMLNVPFRVAEKDHRGDGTSEMTLRIENSAIYAWSNSDSAAVVHAPPMVYSRADTPWQRMVTGEWSPPGRSAQDSNLLKDPTFGLTYWTRPAAFSRRQGSNTLSGQFPVDSVQGYVGQVTLGNASAVTASYDKRSLPTAVIGRLYYCTCNLAKSSTVSGTATLRMTITFLNAAGASTGTANIDTALSALPAGGAYLHVVGSLAAPAASVKAKVACTVVGNTAVGTVRFDNIKLLDKEPGADVTSQITGTAADTFNYDYTGVAQSGEFPRNFVYKLVTPGGEITTGVTWTYKVASGTVNTFTSASGVKSMTGTGYGTLAVSSLGTATADVDIFAAYNGKSIGPFRTHFSKVVAPAPSGGSGGGGSGGGAATQNSGFTAYSNTTFVAVTNVLSYTMPTGKTTAILSANLVGSPTTIGGAAAWTSEGKWQRETSVGSGTWTDLGTVVSNDSQVSDVGTPGEPALAVTNTADLTKTFNDTGRTAGSTYTYRFVCRVSVGGTRTHTVTGSASVTS